MPIFNTEDRNKLKGKKVAILATEGVDEVEIAKPKKALQDAGAEVDVIASHSGIWGEDIEVDVELSDANSGEYAALVLPEGVIHPDHLRTDREAMQFVSSFISAGKPIAAICHDDTVRVVLSR